MTSASHLYSEHFAHCVSPALTFLFPRYIFIYYAFVRCGGAQHTVCLGKAEDIVPLLSLCGSHSPGLHTHVLIREAVSLALTSLYGSCSFCFLI